jgi:hypothetical protein
MNLHLNPQITLLGKEDGTKISELEFVSRHTNKINAGVYYLLVIYYLFIY